MKLKYAMGDPLFLEYGDSVTFITPGGGGYGNPFERDPEAVREEVKKELLSIKRAKKDYGVVIDPITLQVDEEATKVARKN